MPTRPSSPDPSRPDGAASAYPGLGAGLEFFQDWFKAASSALPHLTGQSAAGTSAWTLPTLDPEELDKRIHELKTVQFWLEQNARMIGMTIQTLEVQRMTLDTLKGMKVPMDALRESLKARVQPVMPEPPAAPAPRHAPTNVPTDAPASSAQAAPSSASEAADTPDTASAAVNPMQWWSTLTEQFTNLAQQAVQAGQDAVASSVSPSFEDKGKRKASVSKAGTSKASSKPTTARKAGAKAAPRAARKSGKGTGASD